MIELSLVCPAFQEGKHIFSLLERWHQFLSQQSISFEIVVCNDGSVDETRAELERACSCFSELKAIHLPQNQGAGFAMSTAILQSQGKWVCTIDSDGQFMIEDGFRFYRHAVNSNSPDAVCGIRTKKLQTAFSYFVTQTSTRLSRWILKHDWVDFNCALKVVRGELLRSFQFEARGLNYSNELSYLLWASGSRVEFLEVIQHNRESGTSSARFLKTTRARLQFLCYLRKKLKLQRKGVLRKPFWDPLFESKSLHPKD